MNKNIIETGNIPIKTFQLGNCNLKYNDTNDNCKFATIEGLGRTGGRNYVEIIKEIMVRKTHKVVFMVHVSQKSIVEKIKENFDVISCVEIPIGYGQNAKQYHIHFKNPYCNKYDTRFKNEGVISETLNYSKQLSATSKQLEEAFRAGRKDKSYHIKSGFKKFITKDK